MDRATQEWDMGQFEYDFSDAANREYWRNARAMEKAAGSAESDDNQGEPPTQKAPYSAERLLVEVPYIYEELLGSSVR
jgi:hypothetical protein